MHVRNYKYNGDDALSYSMKTAAKVRQHNQAILLNKAAASLRMDRYGLDSSWSAGRDLEWSQYIICIGHMYCCMCLSLTAAAALKSPHAHIHVTNLAAASTVCHQARASLQWKDQCCSSLCLQNGTSTSSNCAGVSS
jgi:hypothetical protein